MHLNLAEMDPPSTTQTCGPRGRRILREQAHTRSASTVCHITSWACELGGTSSIKDKAANIDIVFRATRIRTFPNHKSSTLLILVRLLNCKSVT